MVSLQEASLQGSGCHSCSILNHALPAPASFTAKQGRQQQSHQEPSIHFFPALWLVSIPKGAPDNHPLLEIKLRISPSCLNSKPDQLNCHYSLLLQSWFPPPTPRIWGITVSIAATFDKPALPRLLLLLQLIHKFPQHIPLPGKRGRRIFHCSQAHWRLVGWKGWVSAGAKRPCMIPVAMEALAQKNGKAPMHLQTATASCRADDFWGTEGQPLLRDQGRAF